MDQASTTGHRAFRALSIAGYISPGGRDRTHAVLQAITLRTV